MIAYEDSILCQNEKCDYLDQAFDALNKDWHGRPFLFF